MSVHYKHIGEAFYFFHHGASMYAYYYVTVRFLPQVMLTHLLSCLLRPIFSSISHTYSSTVLFTEAHFSSTGSSDFWPLFEPSVSAVAVTAIVAFKTYRISVCFLLVCQGREAWNGYGVGKLWWRHKRGQSCSCCLECTRSVGVDDSLPATAVLDSPFRLPPVDPFFCWVCHLVTLCFLTPLSSSSHAVGSRSGRVESLPSDCAARCSFLASLLLPMSWVLDLPLENLSGGFLRS